MHKLVLLQQWGNIGSVFQNSPTVHQYSVWLIANLLMVLQMFILVQGICRTCRSWSSIGNSLFNLFSTSLLFIIYSIELGFHPTSYIIQDSCGFSAMKLWLQGFMLWQHMWVKYRTQWVEFVFQEFWPRNEWHDSGSWGQTWWWQNSEGREGRTPEGHVWTLCYFHHWWSHHVENGKWKIDLQTVNIVLDSSQVSFFAELQTKVGKKPREGALSNILSPVLLEVWIKFGHWLTAKNCQWVYNIFLWLWILFSGTWIWYFCFAQAFSLTFLGEWGDRSQVLCSPLSYFIPKSDLESVFNFNCMSFAKYSNLTTKTNELYC